MITNHNTLEFSNNIKAFVNSQTMDDNDILLLATNIEKGYCLLIIEIANEVYIKEVYKIFVPTINKYVEWCNKNKLTEIQLIIKNTLELTKNLIIETAQPFVYRKEKELADIHEMFGAFLPSSQVPKEFTSLSAYKIFGSLLSTYKNEPNKKGANFSFLYYAMDKDGFLTVNATKFRKFLLDNYNIEVDRTESRYSGTNYRTKHYNQTKEIYK